MDVRWIVSAFLMVLCANGEAREKEAYCHWDGAVSEAFTAQVDESLVTDRSQVVATWVDTHLPFGMPFSNGDSDNEVLLPQEHFLTWYDGDLRNPIWVAYRIDGEDLNGPAEREDSFRSDPRLAGWERAECADYEEPIFDQGHMVPYADLKVSDEAVATSFLMSNMTPQHCRFNRGPWLVLESLTRDWAEEYGTVWVISGTIFDRYGAIGRDSDQIAWRMAGKRGPRVAIPSHQYKIIARKNGEGWTSLSFILPNIDKRVRNKDMEKYLSEHISTVSEIHARTGIRFFNGVAHREHGILWRTPSGLRRQLIAGCNALYPEY